VERIDEQPLFDQRIGQLPVEDASRCDLKVNKSKRSSLIYH